MTTWWMWISMAIAGPASPIELGHDLVDWRALSANAPAEALSDFMQKHPDSPLAELAWQSLLVQQPQAKPSRSGRRAALSLQHQQETLSRTRVALAIAWLIPSATPAPRPGSRTPP